MENTKYIENTLQINGVEVHLCQKLFKIYNNRSSKTQYTATVTKEKHGPLFPSLGRKNMGMQGNGVLVVFLKAMTRW